MRSSPAQQLRILFCNYEYPPLGGGGGVINAMLAEELAKRHDVTVLTSQGLNLSRERVENNVRVVRAPVFLRKQKAVATMASMFSYIPRAIHIGRQLTHANDYDVINTHFVIPTGPVGDHLSHFRHIPNVLSLHGGDLYDPSKFTSPHRHFLLRLAIKRLLRRADCVIGQSRNTLYNMRRYYTPDIAGIRIPLGITRPSPGVASREKYKCAQSDILLVTVGRLVARKAVNQLITMTAALKNARVKLIIIGSGPEEQLLKSKANELGLDRNVIFLGHATESEKYKILRMCDLYVSTSQHEGFGLVFLEAMAAGLPVVCYAHGGQTDFLEDALTGYLLPLNDLKGFQDRCLELAKDKDLRAQFGKENLRCVKEYFIDQCAARYEDIFVKTIDMYNRIRRDTSH